MSFVASGKHIFTIIWNKNIKFLGTV
jgi:hypothetical protein